MRRALTSVLLSLTAAVAAGRVAAQPSPASTPAVSEAPRVEGWDQLVDSLRDLPSRMLAKLPPEMQSDPQVRQDVGRLALAALTGSALEALSADGDHPFFLPQLNMLTFAGQPNPDTVYRYTRITPGGAYRIRGTRNAIRIAVIGEMPPPRLIGGAPTASPIRSYHDLNGLHVDAQGRFDVLLSPERPPGYRGDWWRLQPDTEKLLLRFVRSDWNREREPTIAIERIDAPPARPRPPAAQDQAKLQALTADTNFLAMLFVDKVAKLRAEGFINRFKVFDVSQMGGLAGQFYYEGPYELNDDEALIVEAKAPKTCLYRSIMITNETYDTIDWYNNHSSLNDSQAKPDKDGVLRIVVSRRDPGVPNWLDTAGHARGLLQGRWMNCDSQPVPTIRKTPFADLRRLLPADTPTVTPAQREQLIRDRREALQQRALW